MELSGTIKGLWHQKENDFKVMWIDNEVILRNGGKQDVGTDNVEKI